MTEELLNATKDRLLGENRWKEKKVLKRDFEVWKKREKNTCQKGLLTFDSVDVILKKDYFNKSYRAVFSCGTVYYAVQGGSNF